MNDRVDPQHLFPGQVLPGATQVLPGATQGVATIVEVDGRTARVRVGALDLTMRLAASCLLRPAAGDRVWWCADPGDPGRPHWVTAVLERDDSAAPTLELPDGATLRTAHGALHIAAPELRLESDTLLMRAREARLVFDTAEAIGACWQGVVGALRWTGASIGAVVDRVTLVAKTHQRVTEGSDSVHAGTLDLRARGLATVHAEHVLVEGERLVKSRAPQIHMG